MTTFTQNRRNRNGKAQRRERGVALVAALLTLVLIAAVTAGMIIMSTTETSISANFRDEQTAFFASKAGMEEARDRLQIGAANTLRPGGAPAVTAFAGSAGGVKYILNPNAAQGDTVNNILTNYPDDEICKETQTVAVPCSTNAMGQMVATPGNWETTTTASTVYAPAAGPVFPWKWVRVNVKQNNENNAAAPSYNTNGLNTAQMICWNGINEYADPNAPNGALTDLGCTAPNLPVYVLTVLSVTPLGSRRMVQAEVAEDKYPFIAPAALTMDGTLTTFNGGSSSQWGINGNDSAGCGVPTVGPPVHAIGVINNADIAAVDAGVSRPANITGSGAATPDVANVAGTMPQNLQSVSSLQTLVSTMKANVTQPVINGPASSLPNYGSAANPQIVYVNGDLTLSGSAQGYGILVVTGTLTIQGTVGWNGIILVVGKGIFNTDGTDQYNGAVVVAKTVDALGNPLPVQGLAQVNVNGGGHGGFQYSSGCIAQATTLSTFHVAAIRELMR